MRARAADHVLKGAATGGYAARERYREGSWTRGRMANGTDAPTGLAYLAAGLLLGTPAPSPSCDLEVTDTNFLGNAAYSSGGASSLVNCGNVTFTRTR